MHRDVHIIVNYIACQWYLGKKARVLSELFLNGLHGFKPVFIIDLRFVGRFDKAPQLAEAFNGFRGDDCGCGSYASGKDMHVLERLVRDRNTRVFNLRTGVVSKNRSSRMSDCLAKFGHPAVI